MISSFVVSTNAESMKAASMSLDLILNTVSAEHQVRWKRLVTYCDDDGGNDDDAQVSTYLPLLAKKGVLVQLGLVLGAHQVAMFSTIIQSSSISTQS